MHWKLKSNWILFIIYNLKELISCLTEYLLKIKELAGFGGAGTLTTPANHPVPETLDSVHPRLPCQQAIITFWHTLVGFKKAELNLCVPLSPRFASFYNFLTGKSLNNQYWTFRYRRMKESGCRIGFITITSKCGVKFLIINISLPNFTYFDLRFKGLIRFTKIFLEKINSTQRLPTQRKGEKCIHWEVPETDISVMFYYKWKYI